MTGEDPVRSLGVSDAIPLLSALREKLGTAKKFIKTCWAIVKGEALWDRAPDEIKSSGYMAAWNFNLLQSLVSGSVAAACVNAVGFLFEPKGWDASVTRSFAAGLIVPLTLAINAFFAGYASGAPNAFNDADVQRRIRAFLYYDGAAGIALQTVTSTLFALALALPEFDQMTVFLKWWPLIVSIIGLQAYVTQIAIPARLFSIGGLGAGVGRSRAAAWLRFQVISLVSTACALKAFLYVLMKVADWWSAYNLLIEFQKSGGGA